MSSRSSSRTPSSPARPRSGSPRALRGLRLRGGAMPSRSGSTSTSRPGSASPSSRSTRPGRLRADKRVRAQEGHRRSGAARQARGLHAPGTGPDRAVPGRGRLGRRLGQAGADGEFQAVMPLRGKILNTWEVDPGEVLGSQEVHDIAVAIGVDPGSQRSRACATARSASWPMPIPTAPTSRPCSAPCSSATSGRWSRPGTCSRDAAALSHRCRQGGLLRPRRGGEAGVPQSHRRGEAKARPNVQRFKGLGEMNPLQLRETTMAPRPAASCSSPSPRATETDGILEMLLAKKKAPERRVWLETKGDLAVAE